ncbi:inhibitor of Bruton tyrosine kinase-like [Watersipora subatra]|uniref:inhibitor of Bruton tyrosine kinase-like n=1 Tax=Watersipora subatra TaxID=2589382 RepID=UPI00355C970E
MEYFQTMLTGHWMEGQDRMMRLELPIPYDILYAVMLFVYTDDCLHLQGQNIDIEFVVNVLVVADQLLLERLKEICEKLIISQLTIDNVTQVYQLSITYQTQQLRDAAMFMICLNMAEMLELSLLEELDAESLLLLTNYYRDKMERCMCRRSIGKSSWTPSEEEMNLVAKEQLEESLQQPKRTRRRTRTISTSSADSDIVNTTMEGLRLNDKDFEDEFEVQKPPISIISEPVSNGEASAFQTSPPPVLSPQIQQTCGSEVEAPVLRNIMSEEKKVSSNIRSERKVKGKHKYRSLDTFVTKSAAQDSNKEETILTPNNKPVSPWSSLQSSATVTSLRDVMRSEQTRSDSSKLKPDNMKISKSKPKFVSVNKKSEQPKPEKSPAWAFPVCQTPSQTENALSPSQKQDFQKVFHSPPTSPVTHEPHSHRLTGSNLQEIIKQEVMEAKERERHSNKPLTSVQIEERAMEELKQRYEAVKNVYERITVERVTHSTTAPLWRNQST